MEYVNIKSPILNHSNKCIHSNAINLLIGIFLIFFSTKSIARTVCIFIHGTWGIESPWYLPGGDFFETFTESAQHYEPCHSVSLSWSGKNTHQARLLAAHQLVRLIKSYSPKTSFIIIAHSHGANVAFLASSILYEYNNHQIDTIYALGPPINIQKYTPNMAIIKRVVNFFSFNDLVQPVFGLFERLLPPHERMFNVRLLIDEKQPLHCGLYSPTLGKWLPYIHAQITSKKLLFFEEMLPPLLKLSGDAEPQWEPDTKRTLLIREDSQVIRTLTKRSLQEISTNEEKKSKKTKLAAIAAT